MFNLRTQFFIALLATSALLTAGLYAFFSFSFERGFWQYIEQKEIARAAPLIERLEEHYKEHGNWEIFEQNPEIWPEYLTDFVIETFRDGRASANPPSRGFNRRIRMLFRSVALLDRDQQLIAGDPRPDQQSYQHKLTLDGEIVGYLAMPLNPALRDLRDAEFAGDQTTNLALIAVAAFLFALLSALPLSHFLTKRIQTLVQHVQKLSQGNYEKKMLVKGRDELTILAQHLNDLGQTLQQSEQARRRWVADISHELRTPLAVLQADIESMEDGVRTFDQKALARLKQHIHRLTNLVSDLYDLSLTDSGALTYRKQSCDLNEILRDTIAMVKPQFDKQSLTFSFESRVAGTSLIFADPQRIQQLFLNLLQNSLNYTQAPGEVQVRLHKDGQQINVTVEDSAPGVDESLHEKLFERLYRAESSRNRASGGAGLGLTICRNIVVAHSGSINISHSQLGGIAVQVSLPTTRI